MRRSQSATRLTPMERVVMQHHVNGLSREMIAIEMVVSHHAIDKHLKSAKAKLGAHNMAQAGARYAEMMREEGGSADQEMTTDTDRGGAAKGTRNGNIRRRGSLIR